MNPSSPEAFIIGLDCYDPEGRVFSGFPDRRSQQRLDKRDILLILKWKLGRIKDDHAQTVSDSNLEEINRAITDARIRGREKSALTVLMGVPGIGLAVATAILTVCYPNMYTIIDRRVLEQLGLEETDTADWTVDGYIDIYLPAVEGRRKLWGCSLRDADRALWGLSVNQNIEAKIAASEAF